MFMHHIENSVFVSFCCPSMIHYHNCNNINLDHFQNGSKFLKKVTIDSKKLSTVEVNVSIFTETVVGAIFDADVGSLVGAIFFV